MNDTANLPPMRSRALVDALARELQRYIEATTWRQGHLRSFSQNAWELVDTIWQLEIKDNEDLQGRTGWRTKQDLYDYVNSNCQELQRCRAFATAVKHPSKERLVKTSVAFFGVLAECPKGK